MSVRPSLWSGAVVAAAAVVCAGLAGAGYVTFGAGFGSKWDDPVHGTPATVTWGYMLDGTTIDPGVPLAAEVVGGSDVTQLRADYDATHGAGAFDAAIQAAFDTWSAVADITFVGPVADSGLPSGSAGATAPDIRIGAFEPVPASPFDFLGGVGFGPPGDDLNFPDPLAGDVMFNLAATFIDPEGNEGDPIVDFGNDLQNLFLHELGHAAMGLGHPVDGPGEVMYVGFDCCTLINRSPSPDDITGAQIVYGPSADVVCDNGVDDDGDGRIDLDDPGCDDAADNDERSAALACDDGLDNDGDGRSDYDPYTAADPTYLAGHGDPGCRSPEWELEDPACQNGIDDDGGAGTDFDGGESILGVGNGDPAGADEHCFGSPWRKSENAPQSCGLGTELALLLPLLAAWRSRRRR